MTRIPGTAVLTGPKQAARAERPVVHHLDLLTFGILALSLALTKSEC